jgi:hypothetical protein
MPRTSDHVIDRRRTVGRRRWTTLAAVTGLLAGAATAMPMQAGAATAPQLDLRVLVIGNGAGDPTTDAWTSALSAEGVAYTVATATGDWGAKTVALPPLVDAANADHALFNGVVVTGTPTAFGSGALDPVFAFEQKFGVRQVDGYIYPGAFVGLTPTSAGDVSGSTDTLTASGKTAFPGLKGPVPIDTGTYGYGASVDAGAPVTPLMTNAAGEVVMSIYTHPTTATDPQSGVSELSLQFNYNAHHLHWLLLASGLIDWVTSDVHLGLYRNYFGQDIDDVFLADNEWSRQYQCTPAAVDPVDPMCPQSVAGDSTIVPDVQMSASDVKYVVNWEKQSGVTLNLAFNGAGACTAPTKKTTSSANCTASSTVNGTRYSMPGQTIDSTATDTHAFVNQLLSNRASFNWINHTWAHPFLGCTAWQQQPVSAVAATPSGNLNGSYSYLVTAVTAYGESETSAPQIVTTAGGVQLDWPDAPNAGGPSLRTLSTQFSGGTGFWGYHVYRSSGSGYQLVAEVPESSQSSYSFIDTGAPAIGGAPTTTSTYPTATNPGIDCASWYPLSSAAGDTTGIDKQIGLNIAFAKANKLPSFDPAALVTGEHSGLESPLMPRAFADTGITAFGSDASRQPQAYQLNDGGNSAASAPRYPSNIYYNASNWLDELSEYNTLYVAQGTSIQDPQYPGAVGKCVDSTVTTCRSAPATQAEVVTSEERILLGHVLGNDARMSYAHQTNLIGPATKRGVAGDYGYTLLTLLDKMLADYNTWCTPSLAQLTDTASAATLSRQAAWASAVSAGTVTGYVQAGVVHLHNTGSSTVAVPATTTAGTTDGGAAWGSAYAGHQSGWLDIAPGATITLS